MAWRESARVAVRPDATLNPCMPCVGALPHDPFC